MGVAGAPTGARHRQRSACRAIPRANRGGCGRASAWEGLAGRHAAFRTRFPLEDGEIRLEPRPTRELEDLVGRPAYHRRRVAADVVSATVGEAMHLGEQAPVRALLVSAADDDHTLALIAHEIACDEHSLGSLFARPRRDLRQRRGRPSAARFHRRTNGDDRRREPDWWRARARVPPSSVELPFDRPRPSNRTLTSATVIEPTRDAVATIALDLDVSALVVALAGLCAVVQRYGNPSDVVVGTPHRADDVDPDAVGSFTDWLVLRIDVGGDPDFSTLVQTRRRNGRRGGGSFRCPVRCHRRSGRPATGPQPLAGLPDRISP